MIAELGVFSLVLALIVASLLAVLPWPGPDELGETGQAGRRCNACCACCPRPACSGASGAAIFRCFMWPPIRIASCPWPTSWRPLGWA